MAHEGDDDVASLRASAERWLGVSPRAAKPTA
jgi:hypothetical protein